MNTMTYEEGVRHALESYGRLCLKHITKNCDGCPLGYESGGGIDCLKMSRDNPEKVAQILASSVDDVHTYADEARLRFPVSGLTTDELVSLRICRKVLFDGNFNCDHMDEEECTLCWEQAYQYDGADADEYDEDSEGDVF